MGEMAISPVVTDLLGVTVKYAEHYTEPPFDMVQGTIRAVWVANDRLLLAVERQDGELDEVWANQVRVLP